MGKQRNTNSFVARGQGQWGEGTDRRSGGVGAEESNREKGRTTITEQK